MPSPPGNKAFFSEIIKGQWWLTQPMANRLKLWGITYIDRKNVKFKRLYFMVPNGWVRWSTTLIPMMIDMGVEPKIGGFPPKWMVYNGKPYKNGWFGGFPPFFGSTHIFPLPEKGGSLRQFHSLMLVLVAGSDNMRVSPPVSYGFDETVDMLRNPGVRCESVRSSFVENLKDGWGD